MFNVPCGAIRKQRNDIGVRRFYDNSRREKNKGTEKAKRGKNSYSKNVKTWLKPYWWNQLEGWAVNVFTFVSKLQTDVPFNEKYARTTTSKQRFELAKETFAELVNETKSEYIPVYLQALKMFFNLKNELKSTKQRGNIRTYTLQEMEDALDTSVPRIGVSDSPETDAEFNRFVSDNKLNPADYAEALTNVMDFPKSKEDILDHYDVMLKTLFNAPDITEKDKYLKKKALFNFFKDLFQYTSVTDIKPSDSDKYLQSFLYFQYDYDGLPPLLGGKIEAGDEKRELVDTIPFKAFGKFIAQNQEKTGLDHETFRKTDEKDIPSDMTFLYKLSHRYLRFWFSKSFPTANHYTEEYLKNMWKNKNRTGDKVSITNYSGPLGNYKPKNYTVIREGVGKIRKVKLTKLPTMEERVYNPYTGPEWLTHLKETRRERNGPPKKEAPTVVQDEPGDDTFTRTPRGPRKGTRKLPKRVRNLQNKIQNLQKNIDKQTVELRNLRNEKNPDEAEIQKKTKALEKLLDMQQDIDENPIEEPPVPIFNKKTRERVILQADRSDVPFKFNAENSYNLKDNKEFVLKVVALNGEALEYVSDRLKNDKEVVLTALRENPKNTNIINFASPAMKQDEEIRKLGQNSENELDDLLANFNGDDVSPPAAQEVPPAPSPAPYTQRARDVAHKARKPKLKPTLAAFQSSESEEPDAIAPAPTAPAPPVEEAVAVPQKPKKKRQSEVEKLKANQGPSRVEPVSRSQIQSSKGSKATRASTRNK